MNKQDILKNGNHYSKLSTPQNLGKITSETTFQPFLAHSAGYAEQNIIENIPFSIFVFWGSNGCRTRQIGSGSFAFFTFGKFALAVFENGRNYLLLLQK